jgi:membrane fusion protein (multidrug efflux system)
MKNHALKAFLLAVVLSLAVTADCGAQPPAAPAPPAVSVEAAPVVVKDLEATISAVGTLSASEAAEIRAEIAGPVKAINFSEGQAVKKGSSLIEIDDSLIKAELAKAEAAFNVRKMVFARSDKLKASGYVSKQDWEQNSGSMQEAQADIESARIRIAKAKVPAPFDGIAGLRNFSVGDYVQVGQVLTTVDVIDPVKITFSIPEKNYSDLKVSQKISFSVDGWPGETFSGEIYVISPRIDHDTHNFDVKAVISNTDGRLRPGMFARLSITTSVHKGALVIPEQALIPKGDDNFVFVVRDGKAVFQKVGLGLRTPGSVEVTSGLAANEPVVIAGIMKLQDGAAVKVLQP